MKKTLILTAISFALFTAKLNAQEILDTAYLECSYKFTLMRDTVDKKKLIKDADMRLLVGKKYSKFYSYITFRSDSILSSVPNKILMADMGHEFIEIIKNNPQGERYMIYKNHVENTIIFTDRLPDRVFYNESIPKQDWKITNETKEISGYKCQKATCSFRGRDYVAWFTREIPVKEGPWKFDGLPGLIVKVYDTKEHYDFELYAVQKAGKAIIFNTDGYIKVNMKNYIQMSKNRIKNPFTGQNITFNVNGYPNSPRQRHYDIMERDIK